jgi:chemotaxis receptor (MCP) glutamine deamidase CheD
LSPTSTPTFGGIIAKHDIHIHRVENRLVMGDQLVRRWRCIERGGQKHRCTANIAGALRMLDHFPGRACIGARNQQLVLVRELRDEF